MDVEVCTSDHQNDFMFEEITKPLSIENGVLTEAQT